MKTYKPGKMYIIMGFGAAAYMAALGILIFTLSFRDTAESPPWWLAIFFFLGVCIALYFPLKMPYVIQVTHDNAIEFKSLIKRIIVSPHDIVLIKAANGQVTIRHLNGKIRVAQEMNGFCDFVCTLKSINPSIELKGC